LAKHPDLNAIIGISVRGEHLRVGDIKTIQPSMPEEDKKQMAKFSAWFEEGWLNDNARLQFKIV